MAESNENLDCPAAYVNDGINNNDPNNDFECACGNLGSRLICILGYNGSTKDIIINYSLIFVNLAYCVLEMNQSRADGDMRSSRRRRKQERDAFISLTFVILFQVVLCLVVRCSGVSIIWCAICGWIMCRHKRQIGDSNECAQEYERINVHECEKVVVLMDVLAIVYYAVSFPLITTLAHVCALVLGAILFSISDSEYYNWTRDNSSSSQQTEALLSATPNSNGTVNLANQQSR
jgi:hypothetical protein